MLLSLLLVQVPVVVSVTVMMGSALVVLVFSLASPSLSPGLMVTVLPQPMLLAGDPFTTFAPSDADESIEKTPELFELCAEEEDMV